jgi:hypothetical protein
VPGASTRRRSPGLLLGRRDQLEHVEDEDLARLQLRAPVNAPLISLHVSKLRERKRFRREEPGLNKLLKELAPGIALRSRRAH